MVGQVNENTGFEQLFAPGGWQLAASGKIKLRIVLRSIAALITRLRCGSGRGDGNDGEVIADGTEDEAWAVTWSADVRLDSVLLSGVRLLPLATVVTLMIKTATKITEQTVSAMIRSLFIWTILSCLVLLIQ